MCSPSHECEGVPLRIHIATVIQRSDALCCARSHWGSSEVLALVLSSDSGLTWQSSLDERNRLAQLGTCQHSAVDISSGPWTAISLHEFDYYGGNMAFLCRVTRFSAINASHFANFNQSHYTMRLGPLVPLVTLSKQYL